MGIDRSGLKERYGVDVGALKERYRAERDKRVREDADAQFVEVGLTGSLAKYVLEDPWAPLSGESREPLTDEVDFALIGGGWVGLMTAARLIEAGIDNVRIIESGADFGGTWYWNRYPGAQCDVESYIYLPLLEETSYVPKERYSYANEIFEHAQRIGKQYGLYEKAVFGTWVSDVRWDDRQARWIVRTNHGDEMKARHVVIGTGSASRPRLPGVPGIEDFAGHSFHSSRWDYEYTGGTPEGGLDRLADKRVAVIGTGATGVQLIPHVARSAEHLYVFQRTPSSVDLRNNAPTDPEWVKTLKPGWQKALMEEFEALFAGGLPDPDGIRKGPPLRIMSNMLELLADIDRSTLDIDTMTTVAELSDFLTMEQIRQRVDGEVLDADVAEKLKPYYNFMCKRPTWNDDYLAAYNRPNVTLVDVSATRGVDRITEKGIVANGVEYEVDCIIFASGFEITSDFKKRIGVEVFGQDGTSLYDHWKDGMRTLHALTVNGFPNLFIVGGLFGFTLGGLNYTAVIDDQAAHVAYIAREIDRRGALYAQPTREAEEGWMAEQRSATVPVIFGGSSEACTPGYYNQEGRSTDARRDSRLEGYTKGRVAYMSLLNEWREAGRLEGLELHAARSDREQPARPAQDVIGDTLRAVIEVTSAP